MSNVFVLPTNCPVPNMSDGLSSPDCRGRVLFVDDDLDVLKAASLLLRRHDLAMSAARDPAEAWSILAAERMDVILLDLNFTRGATAGDEGFGFLREIMLQDPDHVVVVVTGHSGINIAVAAIRAGASDFVTKPWSNTRLLATLEGALELRRQRRDSAQSKTGKDAVSEEAETPLLGDSPAIERVRGLIRRAAPTNASVLILGEAGAGKGLIARHIHAESARSSGLFIPLDLEIMPPEEAETALMSGLEAARGGTLLLDEVSALSPTLQARLLAALRSPKPADVRIIATTRRRREELRGRGGLNDDLLYRLNTVEIVAPPLRERNGDTLLLARHFLRLFAHRYGRSVKALTPEAEAAIAVDRWPGDVRALRQAMERCVIFAEGERYEVGDIPFAPSADGGAPPGSSGLDLRESERALVAAALKQHNFNVSHAARQLGLTRAALYRRMAKHGL